MSAFLTHDYGLRDTMTLTTLCGQVVYQFKNGKIYYFLKSISKINHSPSDQIETETELMPQFKSWES